MNQYKLAVAGINVLDGLNRFNNNTMLYEKFLYRFPEDPHYLQLCSALTNKDIKGGFEAAHALKGVTGNLSLEKLHEALLPVVEALRSGSLPDAEKEVTPMCKAYEETVAAIKEDGAAKA